MQLYSFHFIMRGIWYWHLYNYSVKEGQKYLHLYVNLFLFPGIQQYIPIEIQYQKSYRFEVHGFGIHMEINKNILSYSYSAFKKFFDFFHAQIVTIYEIECFPSSRDAFFGVGLFLI